MQNVRPEGTEYPYITSLSGEVLGKNVYERCSKHIINSPNRYDPGFGAAREWKSDDVASIVYMIQDEDYNRNLYTYDTLSLMAEWYVEYCMDAPSRFHMRESYVLKSKGNNSDTQTNINVLSGEHTSAY